MKGYKACPVCEEDAFLLQLKHSRKTIYLGSWRFLRMFHHYRWLQKAFNSSTEEGRAPKTLTSEEAFQRVNPLKASYDKGKKITIEKYVWKKRSIFFDLPY